MGTNPIEEKLIQQLLYMREYVLYDIFLDLPKECDASDMDSYLEII